MITTIQIRQTVKSQLDNLRDRANESYEEIIEKLINKFENDKNSQEQLLIEGYKEMAEESLKISREFDSIDEDFDWEW